jgi:hypothetical protein
MKTLRKLLKPALLIGAVMCCFSCHQIHEGEVIDKYIIPAHSYQYCTTIMIGKVPITQWHTGYVDDEYVLLIRGIKGKDTITEEFSVSQETYNCKINGNTFNDTIPCEVYEPK